MRRPRPRSPIWVGDNETLVTSFQLLDRKPICSGPFAIAKEGVKPSPYLVGKAPLGSAGAYRSGARTRTEEPGLTISYGRADGASAPDIIRAFKAVASPARLPRAIRIVLKLSLAIVVTLIVCVAIRAALSGEIGRDRSAYAARLFAAGMSDGQMAELMADSGPGALRIAASHNPDAPQKAWARPPGWARLDIDTVPTLNLGRLSMAEAERINGVIPISSTDNPPVQPFALKAGAERSEAASCLTAAIYFEAALEPRAGQEAVAQVVLNRMRHAGFPKSVCGVVFQGSDRPGCQFSFACDGSMARPPVAWAWRNAKDVAERALGGYVMKQVGTATHYHTSWVMAAWTPTLVKVGRIGGHIFFRPTGPDGLPSAFTQAYGGGEARVSRVSLIGKPAARPAVLLQASNPGTTFAPASVVIGGRVIALPGSTLYLGRVHGVLGDPGGQATIATTPMHAMIAMRVAAARAVKAAERDQASTAAAAVPARADAARQSPPAVPPGPSPAPVAIISAPVVTPSVG